MNPCAISCELLIEVLALLLDADAYGALGRDSATDVEELTRFVKSWWGMLYLVLVGWPLGLSPLLPLSIQLMQMWEPEKTPT